MHSNAPSTKDQHALIAARRLLFIIHNRVPLLFRSVLCQQAGSVSCEDKGEFVAVFVVFYL